MKKVIFTLFFALFLCGSSYSKTNNTIESELQNILNQKSNELIDINIIFKSQVNSAKLMAKTERNSDITVRREYAVSELKKFSEQTQNDVLSILQAEENNGNVVDINRLWIVNSISCKASRDVIYRLASHPDVAALVYNKEVQLISKEEMAEIEAQQSRSLPVAHIVSVNADHVWEQGYTGKNVIVAVLDSGTNYKHNDIKDHLWEGQKDINDDGVDEIINGWNFVNNSSDITDDFGHGTHCAGIVCGDGTSGQISGVAYDAKLMTVKIVGRAGSGTVAQMLSGVQFAIENKAQILSMSLGFKNYQITTEQKNLIRNAFDNVLAANVIVCAAAGNDGNNYGAPDNIDYPAACPSPWRNPDQTLEGGLSSVICVGAYDLGMSSRGPATWEGTDYNDYPYNNGNSMGLIRPDISAPGNLIYSLNSSLVDKYNQKSGTSQATPCVAGVIALMLEKNSSLTPANITKIIEETASYKPASKNNIIGAGHIDALAAINAVNEGTKQPFITLQSFTPNEIAPGDRTINIILKNEGKGSCAQTTSGTLSVDSPFVTIDQPSNTIGQVSTGNTKSFNFDININEQTPNGHIANFTYVITSNNYTWKHHFSITISRTPNIVFNAVNPGYIDVNKDVEIKVSMKNNGTADMPNNIKLTLSTLPSNSSLISIINNEATINGLGVGETAEGTFTIRASDNIQHGRAMEFFVEVEAESTTTTNYTYEFETNNEGWTCFDAANNNIDEAWWHSSNNIAHNKLSVKSHSGSGHLMSESILTTNGQMSFNNPIDNYLVSPNKIKVTKDSKISFYACANINAYYAEHFGLAVSTTNNNSASSFTTIKEWTIGADQRTEWRQYVVDLSAYQGQEVYVAIRHFFTEEQWEDVDFGFEVEALNIDDIVLSDVAMNFHHIPSYSNDDPNYFEIIINNMVELPMPSNFLATANGVSEIDLMWNAVPKAKGYNVYRNGVKIASNITNTYYIDNNLKHNTEYCYEVAAVYLQTEFERATACATTVQKKYSVALKDYTPKTIYMGVNDSEITFTLIIDGSTRLGSKGWITMTSDDPYYNNSTKPAMELTTAVLDPNDESSYTVNIGIDPNIPNNHVIDFNINLVDASVQDIEDEVYEFNFPFSVLVKNDPNAPRNLRVINFSENHMTLEWDKVTNAMFYNVYRDGVFIGSTATTTYFDLGLDFNTNYCYTVTSCTATGESDHSEEVCKTTSIESHGVILESYDIGVALGQTIDLSATLLNTGISATPEATTATLVCNDPYVNIINGTADLGSIAVNGTSTAVFQIVIDNAVPLNHTIDFDVLVEFTNEAMANYHYGFNTDFENWTVVNYDGHLYNSYYEHTWYHSSNASDHYPTNPGSYEGTGHLMNATYCNKKNHNHTTKTVDDIILAPNRVKITDDTQISFYVRSAAQNAFKEHYGITITPELSQYGYGSTYTNVWEETLSSSGWKQVTYSFKDTPYVGGDYYVGIRHFDCSGSTDATCICIDDVNIINVVTGAVPHSYHNQLSVTVNPSINIFNGTGLWSDASKWSKRLTPTTTEVVIINGDATIENNVTVKSLVINDKLTLGRDLDLTVTDIFLNTNADAFIINDGAQVFQNNSDLAATFMMDIDNPASWGYDHKGGWQFISSPVKNASVYDFKPQTTDYDLFKYDGTQELQWVNLKNHATDFEQLFKQGRGYIVSYESETTASLKGILHNEKTFTFSDVKAKDEADHFNNFYLLGNPFSFNMDWSKLAVSDVYNGYATISNADGSYDYHTSGTIKVGDGFFVISTGATPNLTYGTRSAKKVKHHSLNIVASSFYGQDNTIINLDNKEDEGFKKLENLNEDISEIFIEKNNVSYGIFSFDENTDEVQVSFKAKKTGDHKIRINPVGEFEYVTLIDKMTGVETDMLKNDYSFKVLSTESSRDRFTVKFCKKAIDETENFVYQSGDELIIEAEGQVQIIDVMGRIVYEKTLKGNNRINISNLNNATYIVRCVEDGFIKTQKIVLF